MTRDAALVLLAALTRTERHPARVPLEPGELAVNVQKDHALCPLNVFLH